MLDGYKHSSPDQSNVIAKSGKSSNHNSAIGASISLLKSKNISQAYSDLEKELSSSDKGYNDSDFHKEVEDYLPPKKQLNF